MSDTVNVNITTNGYGLDPSKTYIIEVKADEVDDHLAKGITNALQQLKIKHVLVATDTGNSINAVEVPEERV